MPLIRKLFIIFVVVLVVILGAYLWQLHDVNVREGSVERMDEIPRLSFFLEKASVDDIPLEGPYKFVEIQQLHFYHLMVVGKMPLERFEPYFFHQKGMSITYNTTWDAILVPFRNAGIVNLEKFREIRYDSSTVLEGVENYVFCGICVGVNQAGEAAILITATDR